MTDSQNPLKTPLESILLALAAFLQPIQGVLATTALLVILDGVTAKIAHKRENRPLSRLFVYELALVLAYLTGLYLTGPDIPVLHWVSSLIGLTSLKRVYENLNSIGGGSPLLGVIRSITRQGEISEAVKDPSSDTSNDTSKNND